MRRPVEETIREAGINGLLKLGCTVHKLTKGNKPDMMFIKNVNHSNIGSSVRIIKETDDSTYIAKINPDGSYSQDDFTIVLATDLHIDRDKELVNKTVGMLVQHLEAVKPDLLILTGDIIVTDHQQIDSVQFAQLLEEMGIYWAFVFGNHEAREEKEFHKYFMLKNMAKFEHCLTKFGPSELFGYGNFFINIMNGPHSLLKSFAFFDSGRDIYERYLDEYGLTKDYVNSYDFIKTNQINWYVNKIKSLKNEYGEDVKSMLFMHIPIPEYAEPMDFDENAQPIPAGKPNEKGELLYGEMHEAVGCSRYNSGLFDAAKEAGAEAFFAGHDHINDYDVLYKGVRLIYVQMGGYEIYSMDKFDLPESEWMQGATVMKIHNDGSFDLTRRYNRDML